MRPPPARVPTRRPVVWRWLLVALTVLASLAHLTRSAQVGGLGLAGWAPIQGRGHTAHPAPADHDQEGAALPATRPGMPGTAHAHHQGLADPGTPHLTDAAPNAPPEDEHHTGLHCPFCLTGAFALAAQALSPVPPRASGLPRPSSLARTPALAAVRHADARAPPPLQH